MPSLTKKIIRGKPYYYLRECQRVAGKPKIVSTIYLGPPQSILDRLMRPEPAQLDVFSMWRFRSFLTRLGVAADTRNELSEAVRSLVLLSLLQVVRVSVRLLGPYAFGKIAVAVRTSVENLKRSCAATLSGLPREQWPQIAAEWQRVQALSINSAQ